MPADTAVRLTMSSSALSGSRSPFEPRKRYGRSRRSNWGRKRSRQRVIASWQVWPIGTGERLSSIRAVWVVGVDNRARLQVGDEGSGTRDTKVAEHGVRSGETPEEAELLVVPVDRPR